MAVNRRTLFEAVVETAEQAAAAEKGGANRIELCSDLEVGGTTPDFELVCETRRLLKIPIHVLVRPRPGDFVYSRHEFDEMKNVIDSYKDIGIDGVVGGVLTPEKSVDMKRTEELISVTRPMSFTFHRAFDETEDPYHAFHDILDIGVDRLLTSGHKPSALEGTVLIKSLVRLSAGRLYVMAGGGVREENVAEIIRETGVNEVHASLRDGTYPLDRTKFAARVRQFVAILP